MRTEHAAEWVDLDALHPWPDNPRENSEAVQLVADSISRFGFGSPIVARLEDSTIIAGHTRLEAARLLGLDRVPVRFLDLDETSARLLAVADNKTAEIADWDDAALSTLLAEWTEQGVDLDALGFSEGELERLLDEQVEETEGEETFDDDLVYRVIVQCVDERAQASLMTELEGRGYSCQPLIS